MEGYIGEVRIFAGNFAPLAWQFCQGQSMSIAEYTPLYAIIGTMYGGDGQVTFNLPDLRGRQAVHSGSDSAGPGLQPVYLGEVGGYESITLTNAQMPSHSHAISATMTGSAELLFDNNDAVAGATPQNNFYSIGSENLYAAGGDATLAPPLTQTNVNSMSLGAAGGSQPIPMITPYLALNYIICLEGIFPSRN